MSGSLSLRETEREPSYKTFRAYQSIWFVLHWNGRNTAKEGCQNCRLLYRDWFTVIITGWGSGVDQNRRDVQLGACCGRLQIYGLTRVQGC